MVGLTTVAGIRWRPSRRAKVAIGAGAAAAGAMAAAGGVVLQLLRELSLTALPFALVLLVAAIASKIIGGGIGARLGGFNHQSALRVGVGMISRGEVGLIIGAVGLQTGLIPRGDVSSGCLDRCLDDSHHASSGKVVLPSVCANACCLSRCWRRITMAFLVMYVLNSVAQMAEVLDVWEKAGVTGITIFDTTGIGRLRQAVFRDDLPLLPSLSDLLSQPDINHKTLMTVIDDEAVVDRVVEATQDPLSTIFPNTTQAFSACCQYCAYTG